MKYNKILFIGLGGAGQRHLRIFKNLLPESTKFSAVRKTKKTPLLAPNFSVIDNLTVEDEYSLEIFDTIDDALLDNPDLVVISTPTALHTSSAFAAAKSGANIFVEKPFSDSLLGFSRFRENVLNNRLIFYISFQRRFHYYSKLIKKMVDDNIFGSILNVQFDVASYVPSWHPYEDFKQLYACKNELGGGVLLTEIHEIDLCLWFFGLPKSVNCIGGNYSKYELDVEDTCSVIMEYNTFIVTVNLCFMQPYNKRDFCLSGSDAYIECSFNNNYFKLIDYKTETQEIIDNNNQSNDMMFLDQAKYFLNALSADKSSYYLDVAENSLFVVEAAKESMTTGRKVKLRQAN